MMRFNSLTATLLVALSTFGVSAPTAASEATHWSYAEGTEKWGYLDAAYATCSSGSVQSPVDVVRAEANEGNLPKLAFSYSGSAVLDVVHNGHTIQANVLTAGNMLTIGSKIYQLLQFHVHTPSENFLDGEQYPLELHLVHKASDGKLAVVGVFFDEGASDQQLQDRCCDAARGGTACRGAGVRFALHGAVLQSQFPLPRVPDHATMQ